MYQQFLIDNRTMSEMFACAPSGRVNVVTDDRADLATAFVSTGNYYQVLGARTRLGRIIVPDDDKPAAPAVAVLSSKFWNARFAADPEIVGKIVRVNGTPITIVGVLSPDFTGIQNTTAEAPDISFPLSLDDKVNLFTDQRMTKPTSWWLQVMGRLKPGVTPAQVQGNFEGVFQQTARAGFDAYLKSLSDQERATSSNQNRTHIPRLRAEYGHRGVYDVNNNEIRAVTILTIVVALVLLIVCANVANLLLSRATTRQKELSVRLSLGATRGRLIRQLLTESLVLATMGGALGILIGYWGKQLLPGSSGRLTALDWRVLSFVMLVTLVTGILFGIAPALRGTGMNVSSALKETSRSVVGSRSALGKALLVVQVAISLVLLVGAGLFLRTLHNLRGVDVGFNPQNLLLFRVNPQLNRYDNARSVAFFQDLTARLEALPGVRGVAMSQPALLSGSVNSTSMFVQGRVYPVGQRDLDNNINRVMISPNFFTVMEIPLLTGRFATDRDNNETAPKVALINEAAVRKFFPNENPIGQRFGNSLETAGQTEIIGVVRDTKYDSVRDSAPPTMFTPYGQRPGSFGIYELRVAGPQAGVTAAVREAVRQIDSNIPVTDVSTQIEQVERRYQQERVFAQAYTLFGVLALLLASIGLFGLMSYNVARRTNEIGIRMALGAQREDVLHLVMRESMILVAVGIAVGLAIALGTGRFVSTLLFGLPATDIATLALAILVMVVVSAFAGYLPARRASRVDPMVALHYE
jgi:predicted permease